MKGQILCKVVHKSVCKIKFFDYDHEFSWYYRPDLDIVTLKPSCHYQFKKKERKKKWSDLKILIEILNNLETFPKSKL